MACVFMLRYLLLFTAILCGAQSPDQTTRKVSGTVVNSVTGSPIGGARVQLYGATAPAAVISGPDGRFELTGTMTGLSMVSAERPGFYPESGQPVGVPPNSGASGLTVKLVPYSKISGRILDRDGAPIDGVGTFILRSQIAMGVKLWLQAGSASTDEEGFFLIDNLTPGTYYLFTGTAPLYPFSSPKAEASRYVYPATYYPAAQTRETAQPIVLGSGAETRIDMTLHAVKGIHVTATTDPGNYFFGLSLVHEDGLGSGVSEFVYQKQAQVTFTGVPPGPWKLIANGALPAARPVYGELKFEAGTQDIQGLTVPLYAQTDIPIAVTGSTKTNGIQIHLQDKAGGFHPGYVEANSSSGVIANVPPGTYTLSLDAASDCIASVSSGSVDLLRQALVVAPGAAVPAIEIRTGEQCPQLTVSLKTGGPAVGIITGGGESPFAREIGVTTQGATIANLPEGDYTVYAFDNLNDLEYRNSEVMRGFKSQRVSLAAGQRASVQLEVNERRK